MKELGKRILYSLPYKVVIFIAMIAGLIIIIKHILKNWYLDLRDCL